MLHRIYGTIIIAGILGVVGWFAYQYYVDTQTRIAQLTANNAKLETALQTTQTSFDTYRENVQQEIENFKAELARQQQLNDTLDANLKAVQEANQRIAGLLANTDIVKNSLADPTQSESKINEQVDQFFGAIGCVTGGECLLPPPSREGDSDSANSSGDTAD
jgi:predicted negative regulator of RcsB-dependent stress response